MATTPTTARRMWKRNKLVCSAELPFLISQGISSKTAKALRINTISGVGMFADSCLIDRPERTRNNSDSKIRSAPSAIGRCRRKAGVKVWSH